MKALVLAGGVPQIALIKELKSRWFNVVLCDYLDNPAAKSCADVFYQVSTLDIEGILMVAKKEKVDMVITVCTDQALLTMAKVSEILQLPCYLDYATALNVTNKEYMKKIMVENDVPTAQYCILSNGDFSKIGKFSYPLIVKPVDCNSSKGVKLVENIEDMKNAFVEAKNLSRSGNVIIEEFITGKELSVDVYVENGIAKVLCISEIEKIPKNDKFVIFRSKCLSDLQENVLNLIQKTTQRIADAFKLSNTPMLVQLINSDENVYVLEFSARTGGGEKFNVIKKLTGFDVVKAVVDLTMGRYPHVKDVITNSYAISEFIYCKPGILQKIVGLDELLECNVITDAYFLKDKGTIINDISSSGDRVAGFTIVDSSLENLKMRHNKVISTLKVLDINHVDIMYHDFMTEL